MISPNLRVLRKANRQTLVQQIHDQVLAAICSGKFPPGHRLIIDALAVQFGVSITPVREALRQLQQQGLVNEVPYTGMQVVALSVAELRELFAIRGVLEGYAVRLAADRLRPADLRVIDRECKVMERAVGRGDVATFRARNAKFHDAILARADNAPLMQLIGQLVRQTERYRAVGGLLDQEYLKAAQADHRAMVGLLRARRGAAAEELARHHAAVFADHLAQRLEGAT